jgi:(1->4)-alpha-D-glucan 1-alpha-D-glucosylmutase
MNADFVTAGSPAAGLVTPSATYRVQVQPGFTFADVAGQVPYLATLGVSHLHLSPVLEAVPGSTHGYDVVDHTRVREELGGERGLRELSQAARSHGLGLVLDIVPNHMAVPVPEQLNEPLWSVLREGPRSPYADWFDIDWDALGGQVLLPVLGAPLPDVLDELSVADGELHYYDHRFPLRPGTQTLPMAELVAAQWYRLAYWRQARTELNYRRFFTISDLIAVRVERPEVFEATHATVLRLLREGVADGLRIDHPDGLADPAGYLRQLAEATGGRWTVVEKILQRDEPLPADWACAGTTGYDALDRIDGVFTDPAGAAEVADFYREFTGVADDLGGRWPATVRQAAYRVVGHDLAAEVTRLVHAAQRTAPRDRPAYDVAVLTAALRELLVRIPVYRPYVVPGRPATTADAEMVQRAAADAVSESAPELASALGYLRDLVLGSCAGVELSPDSADFAVRFAQVASALHAKSVEDAGFYRYTPLLSLCEVGRDPGQPATTPEEFHAYCATIQRDRPATGTVLSTHDTKRSADLRLRLAALTEHPGAWRDWLGERAERAVGAGAPAAPDRHTEYTVFQTAVGLGSCDAERLVPAALKAVREAGLRTTWTEQDEAYEKAVTAFVAACGAHADEVGELARLLGPSAEANALGAALLHLTMPGVPDVYQGTEGPVFTLVDPDNRGPMARADVGALEESLSGADQPHDFARAKLRLTAVVLRLRREHPEWYGPEAGYTPLLAEGPAAEHVLSFIRGDGAITAVTRLPHRLTQSGGRPATTLPLPPGTWHNVLHPGPRYESRAPLPHLLGASPVALLTREL